MSSGHPDMDRASVLTDVGAAHIAAAFPPSGNGLAWAWNRAATVTGRSAVPGVVTVGSRIAAGDSFAAALHTGGVSEVTAFRLSTAALAGDLQAVSADIIAEHDHDTAATASRGHTVALTRTVGGSIGAAMGVLSVALAAHGRVFGALVIMVAWLAAAAVLASTVRSQRHSSGHADAVSVSRRYARAYAGAWNCGGVAAVPRPPGTAVCGALLTRSTLETMPSPLRQWLVAAAASSDPRAYLLAAAVAAGTSPAAPARSLLAAPAVAAAVAAVLTVAVLAL